ncbi:MAG: adenylate/guanylate cyclase domain-containing protein [Acidimicrobiia bacterium]
MDTVEATTACANCGFENAANARFCNQCGTALEGHQARTSERRQITVVFSDLSGFTAMSESLDPEDVQGVMDSIFSKATEIIERYSGRVDKLLGDAVMSVFGDPVSHEDDAERAIRATLEIHAAVEELSPKYEAEIGRSLRMHSGINTGVVVTSSGRFDTADTGPLGDTINLAARLEDLSEAGEILLGPETAGLVSRVFELTDYGAHDLKGKSGLVPVVEVAGLKRERTGSSRRQAEFVGRHEELGILLASVEKVQDGLGSVIGIRAEAGSGKTRLLEEFHSRVDEKVQWLEGRAYAYGENIPFAPLVDLISNAIDVGEDDTPASISSKLDSGIGALVDGDNRILDPFVRLYGLPEREGAALDKDSFQDRLLESLTAVLEALCARAPTVLVFQDLHWADPSTIGIVNQLIGNVNSPAVIVANYRPSFAGSLPSLREIELTPLSPRQSGEMVASLLETDQPPTELIDFVVSRTDGNPFYVEEIINSLVETGTLTNIADEWQIEGSLADSDLPTSVRGVIAARIDRLDEDRRRVLREASVVGRQFLYEVIRRVATSTASLDPSLADLEHADLIRERADEPDLEYFFKHALTQDVAYEGLLKKERVELHARAAAAIEEQFAGRLGEVTETLAYHYSEGAILGKAVQYLRAAGRKAIERYALVEAQAHFEKAYALLEAAEQSRPNDEALIDLILDWALLFYYQAHLLDLDVLLDRHQDAVDRLDDKTRHMWWLIWRGHAAGFKLDQTDNLVFLDAAVKIAEDIGDKSGLAYAKTWQIWGYFIKGEIDLAAGVAEEIREWATANRDIDPYPYFKSRCTLALALAASGRVEKIPGICQEVIEFGHRVGNNRCIAYAYQGLAMMEVALGNYANAIALAEKSHSIAKDPIYRDTALLTVVAAAGIINNSPLAREAVDALKKAGESGIQLPAPLFVNLGDAVARMSEGELSAGMEQLYDTRSEAKRLARLWEWLFGGTYIAVILARIASGDTTGDLKTLLKNPRFIAQARRARKEALPTLLAMRKEIDTYGFGAATYIVDVELAKLYLSNGEKELARGVLQPLLEIDSPSAETEGADRVRALLAQT